MGRILNAVKDVAVGVVVRRVALALTLSGAGLVAIQHDEGTVTKVYLDPVAIPTVCTGHVTSEKVGTVKTDAQCLELLQQDTLIAQRAVQRLVHVPVSQDQFDVLVSFTFNVGQSNLASSTLLKYLNAGQCHAAAQEFLKWIKAKGRTLPGLVTRRARDSAKFEKDCQ